MSNQFKLNDEQAKQTSELLKAIPNPYQRGVWYPALLAGKPVDVRKTSKQGVPYLKIRKYVTIHLKDPEGNIINTSKEYEFNTVNLMENTITFL